MRILTRPSRRIHPDRQPPDDGIGSLPVALLGIEAPLAERLRRLLDVTSVLEQPFGEHVDGDVPSLPPMTAAVILRLGESDPVGLNVLRGLRRRHPDVRLVAIGTGTAQFDDAFEAGADAWISDRASDVTVLATTRSVLRRPPSR